MNISHLRTFLAVIDRGSFSEAAKALGISQPAVTMQLQTLEADIGTTLLDRRYRRIDLTEAGRALEPHARKVLAEVESARKELTSLSGAVAGALEIAASTTPGVYVIPRVLGSFVAAYPEVSVRVTSHDTAGVIEAVESGAAHVGVAGAIVKGARVVFQPLGHDELIAICPPTSNLASRKKVTLADLATEDWVARELGSGTRQAAEHALSEAGGDPSHLRVVAQLGTGEAIVTAIEGGLGVAVLSRLAAEKSLASGAVSRIDLDGAPLLRPFFTVLPKGTPTRAAAAFVAHLHEAVEG
jgi:DNA-binding transcriptional LysR family regulator